MPVTEHERGRIAAEARRRGITRVVHFTQSRKLPHILRHPDGIKSSAEVRRSGADVFDANDPRRLDNHEDHISCSIEYPNSWMLDKFRQRERTFEDWAMLFVAPDVLWQPGTLFAPRNAAAGGGRYLAEGSAAFSGLFAPSSVGAAGRRFQRTAQMLECVPTDDQAEVMVLRQIPLALIRAIAVPTLEKARLEARRLAAIQLAPDVPWVVAPDLFRTTVSTYVRAGTRPQETQYALPALLEELRDAE